MDRDRPAKGTAGDVLHAAIKGFVAPIVKTEPDIAEPDFLPEPSFKGQRPGYLFSTGEKGTGYYLDAKQPRPKPVAVKPKKEEKAPVDPAKLLEEAESLAGEQLDLADGKGVRRSVLAFMRKYKANMEMRMKHADVPDKFLESEVDLDEAIQQLQGMAGLPDLYTELVNLGVVPTLLALLQHDNSDIAADGIQLLKELTDADALNDLDEEAEQLVTAMLEANALELLVQRMVHFNDRKEDDEATAVFSALNVLENLVEIKGEVADTVCARTKLMRWLLSRVKQREFDSVKQYASEVLAILVQNTPANRRRLVQANGIDILLQAAAPYKNRDPNSADEVEHLGDLMGILCSCLLDASARSTFLQAEGIELMLLIIKQKRTARTGALKALDYALVNSTPACERFVDVQGLRALFPLFMGKLRMKKSQTDEGTEEEEEACCVSIVCNLLLGLQRGSRRERVASKFVENEFEKCDRLMEIFTRRSARVAAAEERIEADEELDDEPLALRLAAGLFTVQQAALIVTNLFAMADQGMQKRVLQLLHQQGLSMGSIRGSVLEFLSGGEGADPGAADAAQASQQRAFVRGLLPGIGHRGPVPAAAEPSTAAAAAAAAAAAPAAPPPLAASPPAESVPEAPAPPPPEPELESAAELDPFGLNDLDASAVPAEPPLPAAPLPEQEVHGNGVSHPEPAGQPKSGQHREKRDKERARDGKQQKRSKEHREGADREHKRRREERV